MLMKVAATAALLAGVALAVTNTTMPSYYAAGKTAFELGKSIGEQQKDAFQQLLQKDDSLLTVLLPWKQGHEADYKAYCDANNKAYPDIYEEVRGIAAGAGVPEEYAVLLMLRPEIEALVAEEDPARAAAAAADHCFDIIANPEDDDMHNVAFIAHNEDWTPAYKPFGFVLHEHMPFAKSGATHITAFTYPASPVGFTFGYNNHGVVTSCNGLSPRGVRKGKLGRYFINRDVLAATSVDDALERLRKAAPDSALGFGMSVGSARSRRLYHAEMAPGDIDIIEIKPGTTYLHSNSYTHEHFKSIAQTTSNSTKHRLARAAEMPAPTTPKLALDILGDEKTPVYPIYRSGTPPDELATISTALLDLDNALVSIYGGNPKTFDPVVVMPLFEPKGYGDQPNALGFAVVATAFAVVLLVAVVILLALLASNARKMRAARIPAMTINSSYQPVA